MALVQKTTGLSKRPQSSTDIESSTSLLLPDSTYFTMKVLPPVIFSTESRLAYLANVGDFNTMTISWVSWGSSSTVILLMSYLVYGCSIDQILGRFSQSAYGYFRGKSSSWNFDKSSHGAVPLGKSEAIDKVNTWVLSERFFKFRVEPSTFPDVNFPYEIILESMSKISLIRPGDVFVSFRDSKSV